LTNVPHKLVVLLDKHPEEVHFTQDYKVEILQGQFGSEAASFRAALDLASKGDPEDIVCFLEDDYAVSSSWILLAEGLELADYVTLYDHPDKYSDTYKNVPCMVYKSSRHWRTTPSTTNSYAMRRKTLVKDMDIHRAFSQGVNVSRDHEKFLALWDAGRRLVSSMPAAWSHEESGMQVNIT
jgi:hypothetical protein